MPPSGEDDGVPHKVFPATIHVVWDETGAVAAHVNLDDAVDALELESVGKLRRAVAITVELPVSEPLAVTVDAGTEDAKIIPFRRK